LLNDERPLLFENVERAMDMFSATPKFLLTKSYSSTGPIIPSIAPSQTLPPTDPGFFSFFSFFFFFLI